MSRASFAVEGGDKFLRLFRENQGAKNAILLTTVRLRVEVIIRAR